MVRTWSWRAPVDLKEQPSHRGALPAKPTDAIEITVPAMDNYTFGGAVHVQIDERLSPGQLYTTTVFDPTDTLAQAVCERIRTVREGIDVPAIQDEGHVNGSTPTTSIVGEIKPTWEQHQQARANEGEPLAVEFQLIVKVAPGSNVRVRAKNMDCFAGQGLGRVDVDSKGRVARELPNADQTLPRTDLHAGAPTRSYYEGPPTPSGGDTHVVELPKALTGDRRAHKGTDPEELRKSERIEWPTVGLPRRIPTKGSVIVTESGNPDRLVAKVSPHEGSESGVRLAEGVTVDWLPREATATGGTEAARHRVPVLRFRQSPEFGEGSPSEYAGAAVDIELSAPLACPIGVQIDELVAADWTLHGSNLLVNPVAVKRLRVAEPTATAATAAPEQEPGKIFRGFTLGSGTGTRRRPRTKRGQ